MAQLDTGGEESGGKGKHKKVRAKKTSTKVDMTPMVDLAFLLLTFFMLTTTFSKPKTMEITMPLKEGEDTKVAASTAMTIILSENDKIYYYFGYIDPQKPEETTILEANFGLNNDNSIHKILLDRNKTTYEQVEALRTQAEQKKISKEEYKKEVIKVKSAKNALMVLIKTDDKARYKNVVDILDEMNITNIGKYALVDVFPLELDLIEKTKPQ